MGNHALYLKRTIGVFVVFVMGLTVVAQPSVTRLFAQDDPITEIDSLLTRLTEQDTFSGTILIAQNGEIMLSKGYGLANQEWEIPNTPQTKFRLYFLSQQFTGMAILRLQDDGLLTVDDPICDYLDECPEAWQDVTIHHLLTMTSGIPDFSYVDEAHSDSAMKESPQQSLKHFLGEPLRFAPGEGIAPSNTGYLILGLIISEASGQPLSSYLTETFLEPLGMYDTGVESHLEIVSRRAENYSGDQKAEFMYMDLFSAWAGMYSTVEDLYVWAQALFGGEVISSDSWDAMLAAAYTLPGGNQQAYGLAIVTGEHPLIGAGSVFFGSEALLHHYTEDNTIVILLSNTDRARLDSIVSSIEAQLLGND